MMRPAAFGMAYFGLGIFSAFVSNPMHPGMVQASVRLGVLLAAIAVFFWHGRLEFAGPPGRRAVAALRVAGAVAVGTFLLAAWATAMSRWETSRVDRSLLAALWVWPLVTGVPAFLAAVVLGRVMTAMRGRGSLP